MYWWSPCSSLIAVFAALRCCSSLPGMLALGSLGYGPEDREKMLTLAEEAKLQRRRQELTQTTPDQPVDDEAVYYKVAGECPKGR
ncbi:hypothetical protein Scep_017069 [Stephania cephalantha]|uniref:Uncharacterized protein n=1 Tax=Stephania cephalantha TaxID=152367 RepID=A0AAP0NWJ5_9MAGN